MHLLTLDFETYYDTEYSLSKMQTDAYILDPRFEVICVSVKTDGGRTQHFSGDMQETKEWLGQFQWASAMVLGHHIQFDGFILTQRFGIRPRMWADTLSMARALYPNETTHSLARVAHLLGLPAKGTEVAEARGKRRRDFSPDQLHAYMRYCSNDVNITYEAFCQMQQRFPALEFALVDHNTRMFTEPVLQLDLPRLRTYHDTVLRGKDDLLSAVAANRADLMSNEKFAAMLRNIGVTPPMKISKTTGRPTYAFARTDEAFTDLLEHDDPAVQALVAARIGHKTTLAETRALRFIETAERGVGWPVYYHYWGAKTTGRFSGGNKINAANLPSRGADLELRKSILAPPGHVLVVGDSSNIELRINFAQSGQLNLLDAVRQYDQLGKAADSDLYCDFATEIYGRRITKADKTERTVGKVGELSLGYGAGVETFRNMLRVQAKMDLSLDECQRIVDTYRATHRKVVAQWWFCGDTVIPAINNGQDLLSVDKNGWALTMGDGFAVPGHIGVSYRGLHRDPDGEWHYHSGRGAKKLYGGKVVENLCQHLARHVVMWQLVRFARRYPVVLHTYDEVVGCVPEEQAQDAAAYLTECLRLAPPWCRALLPLNCDVHIVNRYGDAK